MGKTVESKRLDRTREGFFNTESFLTNILFAIQCKQFFIMVAIVMFIAL
jgi:hypothetical protein